MLFFLTVGESTNLGESTGINLFIFGGWPPKNSKHAVIATRQKEKTIKSNPKIVVNDGDISILLGVLKKTVKMGVFERTWFLNMAV